MTFQAVPGNESGFCPGSAQDQDLSPRRGAGHSLSRPDEWPHLPCTPVITGDEREADRQTQAGRAHSTRPGLCPP